jgi:hypothetical protein
MSTPYEEDPFLTQETQDVISPEHAQMLGGLVLDDEAAADEVTIPETHEDSIAEQIPDLLPRLRIITSSNHHRYHDDHIVYTKYRQAQHVEPSDRTPEQTQLLEDMTTLKRFVPYSSAYEDVYTPSEIHKLAQKFQLLESKDRPAFKGVESQMIDLVMRAHSRREPVPQGVLGVARRADNDNARRNGMTWNKLNEFANYCITDIRTNRQEASTEYYINDVRDPHRSQGLDLTPVYQYVADQFAIDTIGERGLAVQQIRCEAYVENCRIIHEWYEEAREALDQLPADLKLERHGAHWWIGRLIESMDVRLTSADRFGRDKNYTLDPAGAMSLQKKIGHCVADVQRQLAEAVVALDEEIAPLDLED